VLYSKVAECANDIITLASLAICGWNICRASEEFYNIIILGNYGTQTGLKNPIG